MNDPQQITGQLRQLIVTNNNRERRDMKKIDRRRETINVLGYHVGEGEDSVEKDGKDKKKVS